MDGGAHFVVLQFTFLPSETTFMTFGTKGTLHASHQCRLVMVDCPLEFCLDTCSGDAMLH